MNAKRHLRKIMLGLVLVLSINMAGLANIATGVLADISVFVNRGPERADLRSEIIQGLNTAKHSIDVAMHAFTDRQLANELVAIQSIHDDEIEIRVVFDDNAMHRDAAREICQVFAEAGIGVYTARNLHLNLAILDGERVLTGSAHWSSQSLVNQITDVVVLRSPEIARDYEYAFGAILSLAEPGCPQ